MILTPAELRDLTGYRYAAYQARELARMGIGYQRRRDGQVVTTWDAVNRRLGGEVAGNGLNWRGV